MQSPSLTTGIHQLGKEHPLTHAVIHTESPPQVQLIASPCGHFKPPKRSIKMSANKRLTLLYGGTTTDHFASKTESLSREDHAFYLAIVTFKQWECKQCILGWGMKNQFHLGNDSMQISGWIFSLFVAS